MGHDNFDIIIIGAGSGGLNIASFMNRVGFNVLLIDKSDNNIGGDCLNTGCVPSKALIHVAELVHRAKQAEPFGVSVTGSVDLKKVATYVNSKREHIRKHENATYFRKKGMAVVLGTAKFAGKNSVQVNGKTYTAKKIILATGSRPRKLTIPGSENATVWTNEEIFDVMELPKKLIIIGAGPIGLELGQAFSRLGSKVTVVHRGSAILKKEDPKVAQLMAKQLLTEGITFLLNHEPKKFPNKNTLVVVDKNGKETSLKHDAVLVSIGRKLNIQDLDLEKAGIQKDASGHRLLVDKYLRTTNKNIFVCGDVVGGPQFTHAAEVHARVIITNFFSPFKKKITYDDFAWVTYTQPQIATFGLQEEELKKRGVAYSRHEMTHEDDDRAIVDETTNGLSILFTSKGKLLGGTIVGDQAGEIMQELSLAQTTGLSVTTVAGKVYPYPIKSRVNKKILGNILSAKLTPLAKKIMHWLY